MSRSVRLRGGKVNRHRRIRALPLSGWPQGMTGQLAEDGMDEASTGSIEQQVRQAFPEGAITRVQVLQYGDDPEVELEKTAFRVFFDWPGRTEGKKADPKTVHAFVNANGAAITKLGDELPSFIGWVELRPAGLSGTSRDDGLAFRIGGRRGLA